MPTNPLDRLLDVASAGSGNVHRLARLLPRVVHILDSVELLISRANELVSRLERCEVQIRDVIAQVAASELGARTVIEATGQLEARIEQLVDVHEPVLRSAADTFAYAVKTLGPDQVDDLATYLAAAPVVEHDVLPALQDLKSMAPDLTELLAVSKALNEMMGSVPGLGRAKKRIDHELAQGDES